MSIDTSHLVALVARHDRNVERLRNARVRLDRASPFDRSRISGEIVVLEAWVDSNTREINHEVDFLRARGWTGSVETVGDDMSDDDILDELGVSLDVAHDVSFPPCV